MCLVSICVTPDWSTVVSEGRVVSVFPNGEKIIEEEGRSKFTVLRRDLVLAAVGIADVIDAIEAEAGRRVAAGADFGALVQKLGPMAQRAFGQRIPANTGTPGDDSVNFALVGFDHSEDRCRLVSWWSGRGFQPDFPSPSCLKLLGVGSLKVRGMILPVLASCGPLPAGQVLELIEGAMRRVARENPEGDINDVLFSHVIARPRPLADGMRLFRGDGIDLSADDAFKFRGTGAHTGDDVADGSVKRVPTLNEATGGGRGFNAINASNNLVTGTTNRTVAQIEDGQTRAVTAIKSDFDIADNKVITDSLLAGAVTAAKRVDGAIAQDVPDNRLWNGSFIGTAGQRALGSGTGDGSPTAPTGYGGWATHLGNNENDGYTGNGEYNLHNHATVPHSIQQDNDWSMVGNPGEECVLTVEVKLMTTTTPSHDFRVSIIPFDGTSEGTPNEANFAGSNFNNSSYKQVVLKTTLPNMTNLTKYRIRLRNMSTGNTSSDGYRVRRAMLSRSVDIPRWTPETGRDRASQQVTGGGGGGGGGGTGGGSGCSGGCVL